MSRHEIAAVVCARWENDYIVEFLRYYRKLGYSHVYLYCNDDSPRSLYEAVYDFVSGDRPFVTFTHVKFQGLQHQIYAHFLMNHASDVNWVSFIDVDEFINIADGRTISQFLSGFPKTIECVLFNWLVFGTNGHKTNPSGSVLENYTRRGRLLNKFTKFICKAELLVDEKIISPAGYGFWHNPQGKTYRDINIVNAIGDTAEPYQFYDEEQSAKIIQVASLHHYLLKSEEHLAVRVRRGTGGAFSGQSMWQRKESNSEFLDRMIQEINECVDESLKDFWTREFSKGENQGYQSSGHNLSAGKTCDQSSLSPWSRGETTQADAAGAVNGIIDGSLKFCTSSEKEPWWQVDLGSSCQISTVTIYNTISQSERFKDFELRVSVDGANWEVAHRKQDNRRVGGVCDPFRWTAEPALTCRYVRVVSLCEGFLHLDQVEIHGMDQASSAA